MDSHGHGHSEHLTHWATCRWKSRSGAKAGGVGGGRHVGCEGHLPPVRLRHLDLIPETHSAISSFKKQGRFGAVLSELTAELVTLSPVRVLVKGDPGGFAVCTRAQMPPTIIKYNICPATQKGVSLFLLCRHNHHCLLTRPTEIPCTHTTFAGSILHVALSSLTTYLGVDSKLHLTLEQLGV